MHDRVSAVNHRGAALTDHYTCNSRGNAHGGIGRVEDNAHLLTLVHVLAALDGSMEKATARGSEPDALPKNLRRRVGTCRVSHHAQRLEHAARAGFADLNAMRIESAGLAGLVQQDSNAPLPGLCTQGVVPERRVQQDGSSERFTVAPGLQVVEVAPDLGQVEPTSRARMQVDRSEERRVGKECGGRGMQCQTNKMT